MKQIYFSDIITSGKEEKFKILSKKSSPSVLAREGDERIAFISRQPF